MNPVNISDLIRILDLDRNGSSKIWHSCDFEYFSRDGYEEKSGQFHSFQQINDSPIEKKNLAISYHTLLEQSQKHWCSSGKALVSEVRDIGFEPRWCKLVRDPANCLF